MTSNITKQLVYATPFFITMLLVIVTVGINNALIGKEGLDIIFQKDWFMYSFLLAIAICLALFKALKKYKPDSSNALMISLGTVLTMSYAIYAMIEFFNYKLDSSNEFRKDIVIDKPFKNNDGGICYYLINIKSKDKVSNQALCESKYGKLIEGSIISATFKEGYFKRPWLINYNIDKSK